VVHEFCQNCGCHAEWLLHGMLLQVLLALLVFSALNASRSVLVEAACRLLWKQLFAGVHEYAANCDPQGHTVLRDPKADGGGRVGTITPELLRAEIKRAVVAHTRQGWLYLLLALGINAPWLLALQYVGHHLNLQQLRPLDVA